MEGTGRVRASECFVQRVFLLSLPPSLFFLIHRKPTCQISSSNLVLMLVIVLKKFSSCLTICTVTNYLPFFMNSFFSTNLYLLITTLTETDKFL